MATRAARPFIVPRATRGRAGTRGPGRAPRRRTPPRPCILHGTPVSARKRRTAPPAPLAPRATRGAPGLVTQQLGLARAEGARASQGIAESPERAPREDDVDADDDARPRELRDRPLRRRRPVEPAHLCVRPARPVVAHVDLREAPER